MASESNNTNVAIKTGLILQQVYMAARPNILKGDVDFRQIAEVNGRKYDCRIVDGLVDDESLRDLVSDVLCEHVVSLWTFIPIHELELKFGDDPTCDARTCWYLSHRESYSDFSGCFRLSHGHTQINICDECYKLDAYRIERAYRTILNIFVAEVVRSVKDNKWHIDPYHHRQIRYIKKLHVTQISD